MSNKHQKAHRVDQLTQDYVRNLSWIVPAINQDKELDSVDFFVCPICLRFVHLDEIHNVEISSLDHVPPKALGGALGTTVLMCKMCNNRSGHEVDNHLVETMKGAALACGHPGMEKAIKCSLEGFQLSGTLEYLLDESLRLTLSGMPPTHAQQLDEFLRNLTPHSSITVQYTFKGGNPRRSAIAQLRIAYLKLFQQYGYGAILAEQYNPIRAQLLAPDQDVLPSRWLVPQRYVDKLIPGIWLVKRPAELMSFMVVFRLNTLGRITQHAVLLPLTCDDASHFYSSVPTYFPESANVRLMADFQPENPEFWTEKSRIFWTAITSLNLRSKYNEPPQQRIL